MLKNGRLTYVSLFSSAGVGCYGFKMEDFCCIATNELLPRRLEVQRYNNKCELPTGYVAGDLSQDNVKNAVLNEIERWQKLGNDRVDVIMATPPCQGISVINHKKNINEIKRNSLVVQSIDIIKKIKPRIFIFENVMAFQKTLCTTPDGREVPIGDYVQESLGSDYVISGRILNFMHYGSNSSRTRTLMIGTAKEYRDVIVPYDLYPEWRPEKTLQEVIGQYDSLEWGEISSKDFYHAFRTYDEKMRSWIHDLSEGESAFDNADPEKRPHRIVNGKRCENTRKTRDKYTRQRWNRFVQCVHTRNDQLAAQNTVHPVDDRVFSIRELMTMMTVPLEYRWINAGLDELNNLSMDEKKRVYRQHEINIRQCLGEAVPTEVVRQIAAKIKILLKNKPMSPAKLHRLMVDEKIENGNGLYNFIERNPRCLDVASLLRVAELGNSRREKNAAFYTNRFIVNEMMGRLPDFSKESIRILEPSVGAGSFIPFLFLRYANVKHVYIDVVDIDWESIRIFDAIIKKVGVPNNFTINTICHDFLTWDIQERYDLVIGNPPFSKLTSSNPNAAYIKEHNLNKNTNNLSEMFLEKCIRISDCVALILNKTILANGEFSKTRDILRSMRIDSITDFGRYGFTGLSIETIGIVVYPRQRPKKTMVYSLKFNRRISQNQDYITDTKFPYFLIYRDAEFDSTASRLDFGVFDVYRDRQITKSNTKNYHSKSDLWVLKAKNIDDDGQGVTHIEGYDAYLSHDKAKQMSAYQYAGDESVYLTPNMTYNPRVIVNIPGTIPDGSVAVLIPKNGLRLSEEQRAFFSSADYRRFYAVARNLSTQSINVDNTSVFFYGVLKNDGSSPTRIHQ